MAGSWYIFLNPVDTWQPAFPPHYPDLLHAFVPFMIFSMDGISGILMIFTGTILPVLAIGAYVYEKRSPSGDHFYAWFLLSAGLSFLIFSTHHIYTLLFIWGIAGIPLYMLASGNTEGLAATGKKTLILFGSAHGLMATGAVMAVALSGSPFIDSILLDTSVTLHRVSFLLLLAGGLMTTGIIPLHGWIFGFGKFATSRTIALMPLALMRFTGIYLLIRLCHDLFILDFYSKLIVYILASFTTFWGLAIGYTAKQTVIKMIYIHIAAGGLALMGIATVTTAGLIAAVSMATGASAILSVRILFYEPTLPQVGRKEEGWILSVVNRLENSGYTDLYHVASKLVFSIHRPLSRLHDGVLQTYLVWVVAALVILFLLNGILYGH
ncbi:MAG: hypothetical protein EA361_10140 [Bacteroidetes bacterium]|nr:MAG: hypothetical protein EA361_10140 [Bacteroidota bacterium]